MAQKLLLMHAPLLVLFKAFGYVKYAETIKYYMWNC